MNSQNIIPQTSETRPRFEIGLVMAGAISAGAYTAGVLDFLIEALDQWYSVHHGKPPHEVKIRVASGASAGGMVGAIFTASLGSKFAPIKPGDPEEKKALNPLYRSWVQDVDIEHMLKAEDLTRDKTIKSLLDCTKLEEIANKAIDVKPDKTRPFAERWPFISGTFDLYLSVSNLRGVPYSVPLKTGTESRAGHYMSAHAEAMHFAVGDKGPVGAVRLDLADYPPPNYAAVKYAGNGWVQLANAALATGAFPLGLAPRKLSRKSDYYARDMWPVTTVGQDGQAFVEYRNLQPVWPSTSGDYEFTCVDGGVMNNEPLELARAKLVENSSERMERDGLKATKAVILVDPFPGAPTYDPDYKGPQNLVDVAEALFSSLISQARFKPEELMLAMDDNVYSRFLIAPSRSKEDQSKSMKTKDRDMASGGLGGFGGFLSKDFRHHDFMLGRRNCQYFLKNSFTLPAETEALKSNWPEGNVLFQHWPDDDKLRLDHLVSGGHQPRQLPIIPCVGTAAKEVELPDWPEYTEKQLDILTGRIENRIKSVGDSLIDQYFQRRGIIRSAAKIALWWEKGRLAKRARRQIEDDFGPDGHGLALWVKPKPKGESAANSAA